MLDLYDLTQLSQWGISAEQAELQLKNFRTGFSCLSVVEPATIDNGITQFDEKKQSELIKRFDSWGGSRLKFIPASGAATRMFKSLFETQAQLSENPQATIDANSAVFFESLHKFAFFDQLKSIAEFNSNNKLSVLRALLDKKGLDYGNLPKGLLLFHKNTTMPRTPFEEHLAEAAIYAKDANNVARLHFTVSPEHRAKFEMLFKKVQQVYEKQYNVRFEVNFSEQKQSTDTIAVNENNEPFRNTDNTLLLRPSGHGALLENLNDIREDIVFIKNIDNIVVEQLNEKTIHWKKVLAGYLLQLREQIHTYIKEIEIDSNSLKLKDIALFLKKTFCITLPQTLDREYAPLIFSKLNRPLRVCGMVKNIGEPGGGPFIVNHADGSSSLQIVESAQLDMKDPAIKKCFLSSTHFNPVDLVCSFRNYTGGNFYLPDFRDLATGFISVKSKDGKILKAQELPGLWNGSMSNWNTAFVEVPLITFNPVKTVNDLLRKEHQCC